MYEVEFDDGHTKAFAANLIAEAIYKQVDDERRSYHIIDEIVDHQKTAEAVKPNNGFFVDRLGKRCPRKTTKGWQICLRWKDGSTSWEALKDLRNSHPVQVAEYAVVNKLVHEPAFAWWVPYTLKKRDRIIKATKSTRYLRKNEKFGLELPKTVKRALKIDEETGTTFW